MGLLATKQNLVLDETRYINQELLATDQDLDLDEISDVKDT